jgi:hypothetical protein
MVVTWIVVGALAVLAVVAISLLLARRRAGGDEMSRLVAGALETEWAGRIGTDTESVHRAVLRGEPAEVHRRLAALIADVRVDFEFDGPRHVEVSVQSQYSDDKAVTSVTLQVPWEQVPQPVREEYLRTGQRHASLHWGVSRSVA